ncbi:11347_t:CDS:2 [Acaulospora colombiana]|uniref:11347_t:CDS:1 n=1 Tax=Acaulospora colombiana TaxID=27376 RepID=A0ACA9LM15_9GLOM|nr:11347_t:CDS:2 [Acaulospora colombiana]
MGRCWWQQGITSDVFSTPTIMSEACPVYSRVLPDTTMRNLPMLLYSQLKQLLGPFTDMLVRRSRKSKTSAPNSILFGEVIDG